ncbi:MAG: hypothetical protein IPM54_26695 [Polyangiaceae bacterium]|nr:hypothetical protein [Polyangiaceae bacterium]
MMNKIAPWMLDWAFDRAVAKLDRAVFNNSRNPEHVLIAICDHFEPGWTGMRNAPGQAPEFVSRQRVSTWRERYPVFAANLRDSSGRPPRHTFFYPGDQYDHRLVEPLAELVAMGLADVEVHLHHDRDTRATLSEKLECTVDNLNEHGLVPHVRGEPRWAFIHGNWCLANSRADGAHCGVDDELDLLYHLGCYADFTFPSAPDPTQPRIVNRMYYPSGDVKQRRAHERGEPVRAGDGPKARLFCVQGPLALCRRQGQGLPVRIDAGALTARDPATLERFKTWASQGISVRDRPEWVFVKLSTHGAPEREASSLLGWPQRRFHESLSWWSKRAGFRYHYVTAREMFNIARAAMDGKVGDPSQYRDYEIPPAPRARPA